MRVVILSDTHASQRKVGKVIERLRRQLEGADHILHAGDITALDLLDKLSSFAPVTAVAGNMDGPEVHRELPDQTIVELGNQRIGLIHGWGSPGRLADKVLARFLEESSSEKPDVVVFGHSHRALVERRRKVLLVNPGSPTDWFFAPYRSLAILEIEDTADARIVRL